MSPASPQLITGIQQVGIGVVNATEAKLLYKDLFGMNVLVFEDKAPAALMTRYTGSEVHQRHAILSLNISGGGGFEIWQFTSRKPQVTQPWKLGDVGIFGVKIKSANVQRAHTHFKSIPNIRMTALATNPAGQQHFWVTDPYGNHFNVIEGDAWFKLKNGISGGVAGVVIGVRDMDKAIAFYSRTLGIDEIIYQGESDGADLRADDLRGTRFKRILLKKRVANQGAFCKLFGSVYIELVQSLDSEPQKIFQDRYWGDCGFIHVCFDVLRMDELKKRFETEGHTFTVDSASSFSMGTSAGRFCYVEDPDGTLIELVETHKIPVLKKIGWHINLQARKNDGPLPDWMISMLALNKVK
jgi:catechol 2,3-dioxygenase-like lactoylglutathione lyase family enzyme